MLCLLLLCSMHIDCLYNDDDGDGDDDDDDDDIGTDDDDDMKIFLPLLHTNQLLKDNSHDLNQYLPSTHDFEELFGCVIGW